MSDTEDSQWWAVDAGGWSGEMSFDEAVGWVLEHLTRHPTSAICSKCGVRMVSRSPAARFGNTIVVRRADLPPLTVNKGAGPG